MKGFLRLTKETWQFYLTVLVVSLLLVISNSLYLCSELKFQYVDDTVSFHSNGFVFNSLIEDKAQNSDLLGFFVVIAGMGIVLLSRHFFFIGQRTREFQIFLPFHHRTWVLHDFLSMMGIIIVSFLVMTGIFLTAQTKYNKDMIKAAELHHIEGMNAGLVTAANMEMLKYILCYFIFVLFAFSFLYFGMLVCRNPLAGIVIAAAVWWFSIVFLDEFSYYFPEYRENEAGDLLSTINHWMRLVVNPGEFFYQQRGSSIFLTAGLFMVFVLLIVTAAGKIELSKGKLFYFSCLDYLFSFFCGVLIMFILFEVFAMEINNEQTSLRYTFYILFIGLLVMVVVWWLIRPGRQRMTNDWEVK